MLKFETSYRICRHTCKLDGSYGIIKGINVSIYRVLMMPQICFIAIPRNAARKKLATRELVMPFSIA